VAVKVLPDEVSKDSERRNPVTSVPARRISDMRRRGLRWRGGLGEKEKAFEMERAFEDRDESETWLKVDPMMDSLHSDPRYAELLRRLGLPA
jgi:hypothetical protein